MSKEMPAHTPAKLATLQRLRGAAAEAGSLGLALLYYSEFVTTSSMHQGTPLMATPEADERFLAAVGCSSEGGEILDQFKKAIWHKGERGQKFDDAREDAIQKEAGDLFWYFILLLEKSGWTLDDIIFSNMDKLIQREIDKGPKTKCEDEGVLDGHVVKDCLCAGCTHLRNSVNSPSELNAVIHREHESRLGRAVIAARGAEAPAALHDAVIAARGGEAPAEKQGFA